MTFRFFSNVYPAGRHLLGDPDRFKWQSGAAQPHSSEASCLSLWGADDRQSLLFSRSWVECRWNTSTDTGILGETGVGMPTNVDVLIETDDLDIAVESKLTEFLGPYWQASGGACTGRYEVGSDIRT
jgi:hypothetical protein